MGSFSDTSSGRIVTGYHPSAQFSLPAATPDSQGGGHGIAGFFGNLLGDVRDMGLGLGKALYALPHDIIQGGSDIVGAATGWDPVGGGYWTGDILKGLAGLPGQYAHNYGSGWDNFGKYVYEHPLGFATDVATVASLGGGATAKAAATAADAGRVTKLATEASKAATAGDVNLAASKAAEAGALADAAPEWAKRVLPGLRSDTAEGLRFPGGIKYKVGLDEGRLRLMPEEAARNPLTRSVGREAMIRRATTIPIPKAEGVSASTIEKLGLDYGSIVEHARSLGLTRVDRPRFAEWQVKRIGQNFAGIHEQAFYSQRKEMYAGPEATARAIASLKDKTLAATTMTILDADLQGLAVSIERRPVARAGLKFETGGDAVPGGYNGYIVARDAAGKRVGRLNYDTGGGPQFNMFGERIDSGPSNEALISMVEVPPEYRRQGIGSAMLQHLRDEVLPGHEIVPGYTTPEGEAWWQSVGAPGVPKGQIAATLRPAPVVPLRQRPVEWNVPEQQIPYEAVPAEDFVAAKRRAEMQGTLSGSITDSKVVDGEVLHQVDLPAWTDAQINLERLGNQGRIVGVRNTFTNPNPELGRGLFVKVQLPDGTVENYQFQTREARTIQEAVKAGEAQAAKLTDPVRQEFAQAHLDSYEEPIVQQFNEQIMGRDSSLVDTERERLRGWNIVTNELPMYEQGWTPDLLFDSAYLPLRQASGAKFNYDRGVFEEGQDALSIHRARQQAGLPTPVYMPKYDVRNLPKTAHLFSRRTQGLRAASHPAFEKRNTGHLFEEGLYLKDPVEALKRRASAGLKQREAWLFIRDLVNTGGRPMAHANDFIPGSEYVFSPDLIRKHFTNQLALDDEIARRLHVGEDPRKVISETVRDLALKNQKDIAEAFGLDPATMTPLDKAVKPPKLYAIPRRLAEEAMSYTAPRFGKKARLFVEKPQEVWRGFTLHGSPRWVVNNMLGNVAFLGLQGASIIDVLRSMDKKYRAAVDQLMPEGATFGFTRSVDRKTHLGYAADTMAGTVAQAIGSSRPVGAFRKVGEFMQAVNTAGENAYRRASYMKGLDRASVKAGLNKTSRAFWRSKESMARLAAEGVAPELANKAVTEMEHFLGNYSAMTPFEKNVIRPYIAPFWGFYRHVARLMFGMPFEMPGRAKVLQLLASVSEEMNAQYGPLPDWMQGAMIYGQDPDGTVRFLTTTGVNPLQAASQLLDPSSLPGMLGPIAKTGLEQITGRDVFGNEFTDQNVFSAPFSGQKFRVTDGQAEPAGNVTPGLLESILRNFPQYTMAEDVAAGGARYDTANLLTLLGGRLSGSHAGAITEGGALKYPESQLAPVLGWAGLPQHEMDLASWQQKQAEAIAYALQQYQRQNQ